MNAPSPPRASVIVPACNEAGHIGACLAAVLNSAGDTPYETIVVANGCSDATVAEARAATGPGRADRPVRILDLPEGGKTGALQHGDDAARAPIRLYLDADVIVGPGLIPALVAVLNVAPALYASGTPRIAPAQSALTRAYARFWQRLPFAAGSAPGFGLYAVNAAGRARWGRWPDIISDDGFARLNFAPEERLQVAEGYRWPMAEGLARLIRVRRRQDRGMAEIARRFPDLWSNRDPAETSVRRKATAVLADPAGFAVYALVSLCVRLPAPGAPRWARGR